MNVNIRVIHILKIVLVNITCMFSSPSYIYSIPGKDHFVHYFSKGCVLWDTFSTKIICALIPWETSVVKNDRRGR